MISGKTYMVGIYVRLSKDDEREGESLSVENQKSLLTKHVEGQPDWTLHEIYVDDGWSGTNFQRPSFQRMLEDAKSGVINLILCKDLSRFGRNYIEVGQFTDYIFPAIGCRFVALNDNVDTIHSDNDIMAYKNLFNEFHSRDTSKKVRTIRRASAENGKFMGAIAPYGYRKDESDKHLLVPDPRTAPVVQRIFEMRSHGLGYHAIATTLNSEKIPSPREAWASERGIQSAWTGTGLWSNTVVGALLRNETYIGHLVQCKRGTLSFKNHKQVGKPKEEWVRVENTHEPIIPQALWDTVHAINARKYRPRVASNGETNIFVGLLKCADCGYPLRYQIVRYQLKDGSKAEYGSFLCSHYGRSGKDACTAHIIRESVLVETVLEDIRANAAVAEMDEQRMIEAIIRMRNNESTTRLAFNKQELKNTDTRIAELERLIQSLYEDRVKGSIPETVFGALMDKYERERLDKSEAADTLRRKIADSEREWGDASKWTSMIKKYTALETLDVGILLELIDRIEVGETKDANGQKVLDIKVYYRFLENLDLGKLELEARYGQAV